jgi:serine/threonine protein kinase
MSERYQIKTKIGSGGIGAVYRAFDTTLQREVAIKRLLNQDQKLEEARKTAEYLINEAGLMSKLQHPNIVSVYDVGLDEEGAYIVMEFINGETLSQTIKRGALTLKDFCNVVEQALEALVCAQEAGMLHRDIKPSNVMVRWLPSGSFQLKILDFGLAKISEQPSLQTLEHGNSILGSIYFMSPEQLEREPLDQRTDLYSLGGLLYYTLAGLFPFRGNSAPEVMVAHLEHDVVPICKIRQDIPLSVCDFVMNLISFDRDDRPDNASVALHHFEQIIETLPSSAFKAQPVILVDQKEIERKGPTLLTGTAPQSRLITGTAPQFSTTTHYKPPTPHQKKKPNWLLPLSIIVPALIGLIWLFTRDKPVPIVDVENIDSPPKEEPAPTVAVDDNTLVPFGAIWKYLSPDKEPEANWTSPDYDDSNWSAGPAPIGYGDPLATDISAGVDKSILNKLSYCFRHTFNTQSPKIGGVMQLQLVVDDAAIIYLNGEELYRFGLPAGDIHSNTRAIRTVHQKSEQVIHNLAVKRKDLRDGQNTLAVRVHQESRDSSDCALDIHLLSSNGVNDASTTEPSREYVEVADNGNAPAWQYTFSQPTTNWLAGKLKAAQWTEGKGIFLSKDREPLPDFLKEKEHTNWDSQNIWLRREIELTEDDIAAKDQLAFKVLHDGTATIHLGNTLAAECPGNRTYYTVTPILKDAVNKLKVGKNIINVHCGNAFNKGAFDFGMIRLDKKKP